MTRDLGLYPVFLVVIFWLKDRRNRMNELIDCKQIGTTKLIIDSFLSNACGSVIADNYFEF